MNKEAKGTQSGDFKFFRLNIVDKKDDFMKILNEKEKTVDFLTAKILGSSNLLGIRGQLPKSKRGTLTTRGFKFFIKNIIEKVSNNKEKSNDKKSESLSLNNREIKGSSFFKIAELISTRKDISEEEKSTNKSSQKTSTKCSKEDIINGSDRNFQKRIYKTNKKITSKLKKNKSLKIKGISKTETQISASNYCRLPENSVSNYYGDQSMNRDKITASIASVQIDDITPILSNVSSYNNINEGFDIRNELPRILNNIKLIQKENKRTENHIHTSSFKIEKVYNRVKDLEYYKLIKNYGPIEKNDCFIYGSKEGKFINNRRIINEGKAISEINHDLVYRTEGKIWESFNVKHKSYYKANLNKHKKVESLMMSMEKLNLRLVM